VATKHAIKEPAKPFGLVAYTDGGCRPNPGYGGWGIHGYLYSDSIPKKGSGNTKHVLTQNGYVEKINFKDAVKEVDPVAHQNKILSSEKDSLTQINPIHYIDGLGSFGYQVTNNIGEVVGAANALILANKYDVKKVVIVTDSEYAIKGSTEWLPIWKKNNWIKTDGTAVANKTYWDVVDKNLEELKNKGAVINFKWTKGHTTDLGNNIADQYATIGVLSSKNEGTVSLLPLSPADVFTDKNKSNVINTTAAEGYWTNITNRSPFITHRSIYFVTNKETNIPGEYYLGDHGTDDNLIGSNAADGAYCYVKLSTSEPVIELLRDKQIEVANGIKVIILGRVNKLYEPDTNKQLLTFGSFCLSKAYNNKLDLKHVDDEPVSKEINPPRKAMTAINSLNTLKGVLLAWQAGDDKIRQTNITSILYDIDSKGIYNLKEEFIVGFSNLPVEVEYGTIDNLKTSKIDLCLGIHSPDRNTFKRLCDDKPEVFVLTWAEGFDSFRYATVVKTKNDIGIWAGMYSNLRIMS
jgi:ribonuclease HI